jgi:hypothetical protein
MRGTDMDDVVVSNSAERFRLEDVVEVLTLDKKWKTIRLFGPVYSKAGFWVQAKRGSSKRFYVNCNCYDPESHDVSTSKYDPFYDEYQRQLDSNIEPKDRYIQFSKTFFMQCIVRSEVDKLPAKNRLNSSEKKTGNKDIGNESSFTPVRVIKITTGMMKKIKELKEDNVVKTKSGTKTFNVSDERFGRDVMVCFNNSEGVPPGEMYKVKLVTDEGRTPLTDEEKEYLTWDMDSIYEPAISDAELKKNFTSWARRFGLEEETEDDSDEEDIPKKKKKAVDYEDDVEDMDDDEGDEDFEEEDEAPKKKSKKKPADEDFDDEDEDEDFEEEEEEEKPKKKSKKVSKTDDDEEEDFDEDEEEAPKSKKKSKRYEDEEDEEEDFDDSDGDDSDSDFEDEEDEKPKKKSKPVAKKKKAVEDEDDDDDVPDFVKEEREEKRKSKKKPKPSDFDDDEDDWD